MLVVALVVKAHGRGPVLFRQQRVGLRGETFRMLRLRSMSADAQQRRAALAAADESGGSVLSKIRDDPRVTRPGRSAQDHRGKCAPIGAAIPRDGAPGVLSGVPSQAAAASRPVIDRTVICIADLGKGQGFTRCSPGNNRSQSDK